MTPQLARHLIEKINWHWSWIMAVDFGTMRNVVVTSGVQPVKLPVRVLRLKVSIARYKYFRGKRLSLTEAQLDNAIADMSVKDAALKSRVHALSLTPTDINRIVHHASWGQINLDLED